jgi:GNAT superfamily N-acetyltransferase
MRMPLDYIKTVRIRPVERSDVGALVDLCSEHAQYERAPYDPHGKQEQLTAALFGEAPVVAAWVAEIEAGLVGYATATIEFSTWSCQKYAHMDCLFVRDGMRGQGVGARLLNQVLEYARCAGLHHAQWQTPNWNAGAARFYIRAGAIPAEKLRFVIDLSRRRAQA